MSETAVYFTSILAAFIPTLIYCAIIYWADRYEKEPWWLLTAAFLWGAIPSIIIAFIFNTILSVPIYAVAGDTAGGALAASFIGPPVEESIKGLALLAIFALWRHEIDSILDGIIYGAMVGMGFAMVENFFYFITTFQESGVDAWQINIFMRAFIFGLNHALFSAMTGLGIAISRMSANPVTSFLAPIGGWATAVFLHFVHNASVSISPLLCFVALVSDWGGVLLTIVIIIWAVQQEQKWMRTYLAEEVAQATISRAQYNTICSGRLRRIAKYNILFSQGIGAYRQAARFYQKCSELAYKKHHHTLFGDTKDQTTISQLRQEIREMAG